MFNLKLSSKKMEKLNREGFFDGEPEVIGVTNMKVKVKKIDPKAVMPIRSSDGAAGFDLTAVSEKFRPELTGPVFEYDTGLAFEIPEGHVGLVFPRSSITTKTTMVLGNCVGVIDSDYRGTVKFQFRNAIAGAGRKYNVGERIGQIVIVPIPSVEFEEVNELSSTNRDTGGFGSTGQ